MLKGIEGVMLMRCAVCMLGGGGRETAYPGVPSMFNSLEVKVLYPT